MLVHGSNVEASKVEVHGRISITSKLRDSRRCEDKGWCVKHRSIEVLKSLCVVSNLSWTGHIYHENVACLDSSMWHNGICHELSVGHPLLSINHGLSMDESQSLDLRVDRAPPYIL
jgi:hypothetical protein